MPDSFYYRSGEPIRLGDRIQYVGEPALIELVVEPDAKDRSDWQLTDGGVLVVTKSGVRYALEVEEMELDHMEFVMRSEADPEKNWQRNWRGPHMGGRESGRLRRL